MQIYKKGDIVEIISNIPFQLKKKQPPYIGTITNVDGFYILVKPRYQRWEIELYPNELKMVKPYKK